jgi:hypothetical protein
MASSGLAERTQEAYVAAVRQLAEHYGKSPDQIGDEELMKPAPASATSRFSRRPGCDV